MGLPVSALSSWSTSDIDLALAEIAIQADTGRFGESLSEAMNPGADPTVYSVGYRYVAQPPITNWAERAHAEAEEDFRKSLGKDAKMPAGLVFPIVKQEFTPIAEGEVVEVQYEQEAYGS